MNILITKDLKKINILNHPLSIPFNPIFSPQSPTTIPGYGIRVSGLRTGTMKPWIPCDVPSGVISWAKSNE